MQICDERVAFSMHQRNFSTCYKVKIPSVVTLSHDVLIQSETLFPQDKCQMAQEFKRKDAQNRQLLQDAAVSIQSQSALQIVIQHLHDLRFLDLHVTLHFLIVL